MAVRRRELLAGATMVLAGCTDARDFLEDNAPLGHPLAGTTAVAYREVAPVDHDLAAMTDEALAFWNENAAEYAGVEVDFHRVPATESPDVEIRYLADRSQLDGCGDHTTQEVLGCAPLLRDGTVIDRPVVAEVVATDRPYGEVVVTTQHEFGHLLGLGHDAEPAYVMSNRIRDRLPEYDKRIEVLETFQAAWETRNEGTRTYNDGIQYWNDDEYDRAVEPFASAADQYRSITDRIDSAEETATAFEEMVRPETVDRDRLATYFETTRTVTNLLVDAAEAMREAAEAMANRDRRTARDRQETANQRLEERRSIDAPTPADVGKALGLIRDDQTSRTPAEPQGS